MTLANKCMLTTVDNPYNPFTRFDEWFQYDIVHSNRTCEMLASFAFTSTEFSDSDNEEELERAMNEIVALLPETYKKFYENDKALIN